MYFFLKAVAFYQQIGVEFFREPLVRWGNKNLPRVKETKAHAFSPEVVFMSQGFLVLRLP